jgi:lipoate-protein ligase A
MHRLNLTLPTPAANVALDEALLDWAEESQAGATDTEVLRIWESPQPLVVAGRSSRIEQEIDVAECERRGIPILRRSSGGAAIVAGPGCLMYAAVLSLTSRPELRDITRAHRFVLDRLASALRAFGVAASCAGTSDLVIGGQIADCGTQRIPGIADSTEPANHSPLPTPHSPLPKKFSGNSLRVKRTHFLYHGTLLYDFDLSLIEACLRTPPRQPAYRGQRSHLDFVTNLPLSRAQLIEAVDAGFPTAGPLADVPLTSFNPEPTARK